MVDIFDQDHHEFIKSEDFIGFIKEMYEYGEKETLSSEK
jgi:hypothetical protein